MRRFIGFIILLALAGAARGQTAYSYRYWFDADDATVYTGSTSGETTAELDIGSLAKGAIHALHIQALDTRDKWGAVHTTYFYYTRGDNEGVTARYWFDNQTTMQTVPAVNGTVEFDVAELGCGVHALHIQVFDASGGASPVQTAYFYKGAKSATARYWFDNQKTMQTASAVNGMIDLDFTGLNFGIHALHFQTFSAAGEASPVHTAYFYMNKLQFSTLSCRIWIDEEVGDAVTVGLTGEDIEIEAEDLSLGMHDLHVILFDASGQQLAEGTAVFEVKEPTVTITLSSLLETFSCEKDLDFSGVPELRAYTAAGFHRLTGNVLMMRVKDVPAEEGLLLMGEPGTYEVPVRKSYSYYSNLLVGTTESIVMTQTSDGYANYLLSSRDGEDGFFPAEDGSTLAAGKAYLRVPSGEIEGVQQLRMTFNDNPDAIASPIGETEEGAIYNLAGQRMDKLQKGIYIKGGKKVFVK